MISKPSGITVEAQARSLKTGMVRLDSTTTCEVKLRSQVDLEEI